MDVREFLRTNKTIRLSEVARLMWPDNKTADTYLSRKLSGDRPFTKKDAVRAMSVLNDLGIAIAGIDTP